MPAKGIYLAMKPIYNQWSKQLDSFQLYLLNHSDEPFSYHIEASGDLLDFFCYEGNIASNDMVDLDILALSEFNRKIEIKLIVDHKEHLNIPIKAAKFKKAMVLIPIIEVEGYLFAIKEFSSKNKARSRQEEIDINDAIKDIKNAWAKPAKVASIQKSIIGYHEKIVDLHMEVLDPSGAFIDSNQFLSFQLQVMEQELDSAIASNYQSIIFIHGIGNGILKNAIFTRLKNHPHVKSCQTKYDPRFGYGAMEVKFK